MYSTRMKGLSACFIGCAKTFQIDKFQKRINWSCRQSKVLKFVYSEKATKFCKISTLLLSTVHKDKSKVEISQNFVAFSEYMNFI